MRLCFMCTCTQVGSFLSREMRPMSLKSAMTYSVQGMPTPSPECGVSCMTSAGEQVPYMLSSYRL